MVEKMPYYYTTGLKWTEEKQGSLSADRSPDLSVATPPEFGGPVGYWSPELLFVGAANACVLATFLAIAENSRLTFVDYSSTATGKLEKIDGGGMQITEIVIKACVSVKQEKDRERIKRVLAKAEENCLVSRSMKARVKVEPEIVVTTA